MNTPSFDDVRPVHVATSMGHVEVIKVKVLAELDDGFTPGIDGSTFIVSGTQEDHVDEIERNGTETQIIETTQQGHVIIKRTPEEQRGSVNILDKYG